MQLPRSIHKEYFLVRIDRQVQRQKRTRLGSLFLSPVTAFMKFNQQCGEIVRTGAVASHLLPEAQRGDILFFHHSIEGSLDDRGGDRRQWDENNKAILMQDEESIYYMVHHSEAYGCIRGGEFFMMENWMLCEGYHPPIPDEEELVSDEVGRKLRKEGSLFVLAEKYELSDDQKMDRIEKIKADIEMLSKSGVDQQEGLSAQMNRRRDQVRRQIAEWMKEMEQITRSMHKKRFTPYVLLHAHPSFYQSSGVSRQDSCLVYYFCMGSEGAPTIDLQEKIYYRVPVSQVGYFEKI